MTIWSIERPVVFPSTKRSVAHYASSVGSYASSEDDAEFLRSILLMQGIQNAVLTSNEGRCFVLKDGYLFDLDYDPNEFFDNLPLWQPHGEKK